MHQNVFTKVTRTSFFSLRLIKCEDIIVHKFFLTVHIRKKDLNMELAVNEICKLVIQKLQNSSTHHSVFLFALSAFNFTQQTKSDNYSRLDWHTFLANLMFQSCQLWQYLDQDRKNGFKMSAIFLKFHPKTFFSIRQQLATLTILVFHF